MAIKPKGKKVTGTNKADKITWINSKPWKVGLTVNGLGGNDVINFKKSNYKNKLNGGAGNDKIYGGKKNDTIHGNAGNDLLVSGSGSDKLYGDSGKNTIKSGAGNDSIYAGKGNDTIYGGDGSDYISLTKGGKNKVYGGNGNDKIVFGLTNNYIDGGAGDDKIYGQGGSNTIKGGTGNDTISAGIGGYNNIDGGDGNDSINASDANSSTLYGGNGDDTIYGSFYNDYIDGGAGKDKIFGLGGANTLNGGAGNDTFSVSSGENTINGGADNDIVSIEGGVNVINAGTGNNAIHFNSNTPSAVTFNNTIVNGGGTDTVYLDDMTSFENFSAEFDSRDLEIYDSNDHRILLKGFKDGHSVKYISINGDTRDISGLIGLDTYSINGIKFVSGNYNEARYNSIIIGSSGGDTIGASGNNNILIGGDGADTFEFQCGPWNTVFTSSDITHNTIVLDNDNTQDTINILTDKNYNGILLRKNGNDMVIWYKQQYYSGDNPDSGIAEGIYQIDGKDTYVYDDKRYFASITIKDYFIKDNPTVDKIVMGIPGIEQPNEYSIMSLFQPQVDLDNCYDEETDEYIGLREDAMGTYDAESRTYTGTKYSDYIYTRRGIDNDGAIVYGGAGNDSIYSWGRPDSVYGESGNDTIIATSACPILDGGTGDDEISVQAASGTNPQGYVKIFGGEGSDVITVAKGSAIIYTNSESGGKDTTADVVDTVTINSTTVNDWVEVYAQSETNILENNNTKGNDSYYAYADQHTTIIDAGGSDVLTVLGTAHDGLHIAFNIAKNGTSITADSLWILDDTNYANWQTKMANPSSEVTFTGINLKGSSIYNIEAIYNETEGDRNFLDNGRLNALQSAVAGWLGSGGRDYADVAAALASEDKEALITFIADNTNWQAYQSSEK